MIELFVTDKKIELTVPYLPEFPIAARSLGGKWDHDRGSWFFNPGLESLIREICIKFYGTDGLDNDDLVTVRAVAGNNPVISSHKQALYLGPIQIARAYGRDSGAKLNPIVRIIDGHVFSCGTRKRWNTALSAGSVIEIRNVPAGVAKKVFLSERKNRDWKNIIIIEKKLDREELKYERSKLKARLSEIDEILGE